MFPLLQNPAHPSCEGRRRLGSTREQLRAQVAFDVSGELKTMSPRLGGFQEMLHGLLHQAAVDVDLCGRNE